MDMPSSAADEWRKAVARARGAGEEAWQPERWERDDAPVGPDAPARRRRRTGTPAPVQEPAAGTGGRRGKPLPPPVRRELEDAVGPRRAPRLTERLADAARSFDRERYTDARRVLKPLAEEAPGAAAVRELHGLTLYRMGRWRDAAKELEAYRSITGAFDQHPVLADCYRALKRYPKVDELWRELREASPGPDLVAEGRIVAAGAAADQGRLADAIGVLEPAAKSNRRPRDHHLRLWYALGDLYERAGDVPRARELFMRVATADREFADVAERLAAL